MVFGISNWLVQTTRLIHYSLGSMQPIDSGTASTTTQHRSPASTDASAPPHRGRSSAMCSCRRRHGCRRGLRAILRGVVRLARNHLNLDPNGVHVGADRERVSVGEVGREQAARDRALEVPLHDALERARAKLRIVSEVGEDAAGSVVDEQLNAARVEPPLQPPDLQPHDVIELPAAERVEDDGFIESVEEFGAVAGAQFVEHSQAHLFLLEGVGTCGGDGRATDVGGEDDDGVLEVDGASLTVGEPPVVEHLQQHVEDLRMGLVHLIEEDDRIGPPPHRLRQLAALVVAHVAGRRADEARDGVALRELGHVEARDGVLRIEELLREGLAQLRLAHAGGADEQKHAEGPLCWLEAGARDAHCVRDDAQSVGLADDLLGERGLHLEQLVLLRRHQPVRRDARRARDHLRNVRRRHLLPKHPRRAAVVAAAVGGTDCALPLLELLLQPRQHGVRELARAAQVAVALRHRELLLRLR
mmetsp:Transcript_28368/g.74981  ORF Transcript_28368/g.74981 Transcript_28368/m.74981 type:complete len:474 (+) Transcript_28368:94-1515(+)